MKKSDAYAQITSLLTQGEASEAQRVFDAQRPNLPAEEVCEIQGNLLYYQKDYQGAVDSYESAIALNAEYECARYHYLIGVQLEREKDFPNAFLRYQAAIETESSFVDAYVELGGLLVKADDLEGALTCYTDAAKCEPRDLAISHNLVTILQKLVVADPDRYSALLRDAASTHAALKESQPPVNPGHVW
ncbi:MAG TPA: tetratricopeptide repeat protein [Pirellulales bacterium]